MPQTWSRADVRAKPFADLDLDVPSNQRELSTLAGEILRDQEGVLKVRALLGTTRSKTHHSTQYFLEVLRGPARRDILSRQQELRELEAATVHPPRDSMVDSGAAIAAKVEPPTATSQTVPWTAAASRVANVPLARAPLYLEKAKGFGEEWEIFVTDNANKQLRKLRKDSKDVFMMVMKKMRCALGLCFIVACVIEPYHRYPYSGISHADIFRRTTKCPW